MNNEINLLVNRYKNEVFAIDAIKLTWNLLHDDAKNACARDFDDALISREIILEECAHIKNNLDGVKILVSEIDSQLLLRASDVAELYGLDVKSYLNID